MVTMHKVIDEKRKRVSKKKKKSWRKHIDTKDVDSFLDDKRLEERLGTPFSERQNDELFQIDNEAEVSPKNNKISRTKKPIKPLKCFEILELRSAVPDPIKKRNRVRTPEERKRPFVKKIEEERKQRGILKLKEIIAVKNRNLAKEQKNNRPKRGEFKTDIWDDTDKGNTLGPDSEWLTPTTKFHYLKNTGKFVKKVPDKLLTKPSENPAIESPHPGMSYNPSFGDHQNLLQEVANKEMQLMKEEKHLQRVTSKMFSKVTPAQKEALWMNEMLQGLPKTGEKEEKKEDEDDNEYRAINPPAKNAKKTLKKRRKLKEAKMEELRRKDFRTEKKKVSDIYRLRLLNKEIDVNETKIAKLRQKREKVNAIKAKEPKQLSKRKFEPLALEFNLGEELKGNLRNIKVEGNMLEDRYKSFQKRNILEPTVRQKRLKAKVKAFERKSHKMGWEPQGY